MPFTLSEAGGKRQWRAWWRPNRGFRRLIVLSFMVVGLRAHAAAQLNMPASPPVRDLPPVQGLPSAPAPALDELLVTGERPGPALWHVSKGDHELWILATLEPLPKAMIWRSEAVDSRIAQSQVVLAPPRVDPKLGFFRAMSLLPSLYRARKSPDGKTLEQSLPHDLYIRWLALRVKYLGNGAGDENLRPMLAALDLYMHAIDQSGLTSDDNVWKTIEQAARKRHVPIMPITLELPVEDPKGSIHELDRISSSAEIACLAATVQHLETGIGPMRQRANLWSLGDVDGLRAFKEPDERMTCLDAIFTAPKLQDQLEHAKSQLDEAWFAAATNALSKNASSLAVLPLSELLKSNGVLARFRAAGFDVGEP